MTKTKPKKVKASDIDWTPSFHKIGNEMPAKRKAQRSKVKPLTLTEIDAAFPNSWQVTNEADIEKVCAPYVFQSHHLPWMLEAKTLRGLEGKIKREIAKRKGSL